MFHGALGGGDGAQERGIAGRDGEDDLTGHSISDLVSGLSSCSHVELSRHSETARVLDRYYTWTRYPSDRSDAEPCETYDRRQVEEGTEAADEIVPTSCEVLKPRRNWWSLPAALFRMTVQR